MINRAEISNVAYVSALGLENIQFLIIVLD